MKEISLSGTPNRHPSATSSTIITLKPTAKNTVPTLECCPCDISGISFSTTTYSMAPAKRSMALRYYKLGETPAYYITAWYKLLSGKWEFGKVHATETTVEGVTVELTTADGSEYGLHHVTNIWRGTELGFNTDEPYMQKPRDWLEGMKHSSTAQTMRHLRVEVMELCEGAGLYQIDLLNGSKERVSEAEYWARRRGQLKLDRENAALTAAGQPPKQKKFETVKDTLRRQISSVLYRATSFEDFSDRLMQQYSITVKESRECLSYLPAGRTKFIRAKHLGDKFDKAAVLATLQANAERKPKAQFKQDTIGKLVDIQAKLKQGKGIGYERWAKKHNLKAMSQTLILLQEKGLLNEDALNQRITELETKYHDALAVVKDLEGRMKFNKELRYHVAAYSGINYSALEVAVRRIQQDFDFLMRYLPKLPDDSYAKTETLKILKQHKAYMAQFEEMLNDEKIA